MDLLEKNFRALVWCVGQSYMERQTDYARMPNQVLGKLLFRNFIFQCQCHSMVFFRTVGDLPTSKRKAEAIVRMASIYNRELLKQMYKECPDKALIGFLLFLKLEQAEIDVQLATVGRNKDVGIEFLRLMAGSSDVPTFEKLLQVDQIRRSYRPYEQEVGDIKNSSWMKAYELYRGEGDTLMKLVETNPVAEFPLGMHAAEKVVWDSWLSCTWNEQMPGFLRELLPVLEGSTEEIPEKVRAARREEWRKIKRRKKKLNDPVAQYLINIRLGLVPKSIDTNSDKLPRVFSEAKKRWGNKAEQALIHLSQGKTEKEAAKLAGITDRTLRNHLTKLEKALVSKS